MQRTLSKELVSWKNRKDRKPLILKGVRQSGKTYLLKEFGKVNYKDLAYFNFEENKNLASIFNNDLDVQRIIFELSTLRGKKIVPRETLIFFDEIQVCSNALTSLKYFCENASNYHIVSAGSLLGLALNNEHSFPVGKVEFLTLFPMSFYEFLLTCGEDLLIDYIDKITFETKIPEVILSKLNDLLKQYFLIGGMPEAVATWHNTHDLEEVERVQQNILSSYELDFAKHAPTSEFPKLSAIWKSIPEQLSKPNKKFIFSHINGSWRAKNLEDALIWLENAGLIYKVYKIEKPFMPLSSYANYSDFKIYMSDVGLLRRLANVPAQVIHYQSDTFTEFKGALTENYVLTELIKSNMQVPFYWSSGNKAEVDFVIQKEMDIIPIEVKSTTNLNSRSLSEYRKKYAPKYSIKTSMKNTYTFEEVSLIPLSLISLVSKLN